MIKDLAKGRWQNRPMKSTIRFIAHVSPIVSFFAMVSCGTITTVPVYLAIGTKLCTKLVNGEVNEEAVMIVRPNKSKPGEHTVVFFAQGAGGRPFYQRGALVIIDQVLDQQGTYQLKQMITRVPEYEERGFLSGSYLTPCSPGWSPNLNFSS
jgi:hypothetical protein